MIFFYQGTAVVDFTGSTCEVYGNCNAPRAVTLSALIYCLRCMVGHDVPLNQVNMGEKVTMLYFVTSSGIFIYIEKCKFK